MQNHWQTEQKARMGGRSKVHSTDLNVSEQLLNHVRQLAVCDNLLELRSLGGRSVYSLVLPE